MYQNLGTSFIIKKIYRLQFRLFGLKASDNATIEFLGCVNEQIEGKMNRDYISIAFGKQAKMSYPLMYIIPKGAETMQETHLSFSSLMHHRIR